MAKKHAKNKGNSRNAPSAPAREAGRLSAHRPVFERLLFALALLGVLTTVHLIIQQGRGFDRGCLGFSDPGTVSATFDCEAVTQSSAGQLFGVSNGVWGLIFYVVVVGVCGLIALGSAERRLWWKRVRAGLLGMGLLYSFYLSYVQYVVLEELCALCLTSAVIVLLLCLVQTLYLYWSVEPSRARRTEPEPSTNYKLYGALAGLAVLLVAADFAYFNTLEAAPPPQQAPPVAEAQDIDLAAQCRFDEEKPVYQNFELLVDSDDPYKGSADAPVTILEYFDPNCPHCKSAFPILNEVAARYPDKARIVYKPVAIVGQQSVTQVAALHAAADEGKFFEMLDLQFASQNPSRGNSLDELRGFARRIGMDDDAMARRIRSGDFRKTMQDETRIFRQLGLTGVPTIILDGHTVASRSRSAACLGYFIDQAVQQEAPSAVETPSG